MGRLDGNERWPAIPVGRADFERSLPRIPGLRLRSFSTANRGQDLITKAELEFSNIDALLAFLDSTGSRTYRTGPNRLSLRLLDPSPAINADLVSLLQEVSAGYEIGISLSAPSNAQLAVIPSSVQAARLVSQGRTVSFAIATGDIFNLHEGLALEISW